MSCCRSEAAADVTGSADAAVAGRGRAERDSAAPAAVPAPWRGGFCS